MLNWLMDKIVKSYVTKKIKEIKEIDIRNKILEYLAEHKEEIIEKAKEAINEVVKSLVAKIVEKFENKIQK